MAWAVTETFDVSWEDYRRVVDEGSADLPDGLHDHLAGPEANGIRTMSVWESEEDFNAFREQRGAPAAARVLGEWRGDGSDKPRSDRGGALPDGARDAAGVASNRVLLTGPTTRRRAARR